MSKKNLLNESQVRQFMKLARLETLNPGFVQGLTKSTLQKNESHARGRNEGAAGYNNPDQNSRNEGLEDDLDGTDNVHDIEDADADMDHANELEDDAAEDLGDVEDSPCGDGRTIDVDDFLTALESALEGVLGDEVEIDSDEMEDEAEDDFAPEGEDVVADVEIEDEMMEEGTEEEVTSEATDDLVEQITKRVAARILKSALAKK